MPALTSGVLSSPTNATILDGVGIGTITNDDGLLFPATAGAVVMEDPRDGDLLAVAEGGADLGAGAGDDEAARRVHRDRQRQRGLVPADPLRVDGGRCERVVDSQTDDGVTQQVGKIKRLPVGQHGISLTGR